jgi:hypothetical protein
MGTRILTLSLRNAHQYLSVLSFIYYIFSCFIEHHQYLRYSNALILYPYVHMTLLIIILRFGCSITGPVPF